MKLKKTFTKAGLNVSFKSSRNLNSIFTQRNKQQLPPNSYPGVYLVPCKCESRYTGQTQANVIKRTNQHRKAVFYEKHDDSALAEHSYNCNQDVNWEDVKTVSIQPNYFKRCVRESLEIRRLKTGPDSDKGINKDYGLYVTTNVWNSLLNKSANMPIRNPPI